MKQEKLTETEWKKIATDLFDIIDDIDSASDLCKSDDNCYRKRVGDLTKRRFKCAETDGYKVIFKR
jgi:hypothetical protein